MKLAWILAAYLIGSIPSGFMIFRLGEKKDIREFGSRSTGATNVLRLKGWSYALPVLVMDVLKAALPVWLALRAFPADRRVALGVALMVVLGHCYPVFIGFKGGKGVSTAMGSYAVLATVPFVLSLAVAGAVIRATRYLSWVAAGRLVFSGFRVFRPRRFGARLVGLGHPGRGRTEACGEPPPASQG
jgi:glycerol-3-phosphate acyltransferase PlsY